MIMKHRFSFSHCKMNGLSKEIEHDKNSRKIISYTERMKEFKNLITDLKITLLNHQNYIGRSSWSPECQNFL